MNARLETLLRLALTACDDADALPVFGDAMFEAEADGSLPPWVRLTVLRLMRGPERRKARGATLKRIWKRSGPARPTAKLARAVAAALLCRSWRGPWLGYIESTVSAYEVLRRMWPAEAPRATYLRAPILGMLRKDGRP